MAYGDFKDLTKRTVADKILHDKAFNTAKNPKYDGYQCGLASMAYKFSDKKSDLLARSETFTTQDKSAYGSGIKNENISDQQ